MLIEAFVTFIFFNVNMFWDICPQIKKVTFHGNTQKKQHPTEKSKMRHPTEKFKNQDPTEKDPWDLGSIFSTCIPPPL